MSKLKRKIMVLLGFISKENEPKRCTVCFCTGFRYNIKDMIEYTVCEKEVRCYKCESLQGYWSYGYFMPRYF